MRSRTRVPARGCVEESSELPRLVDEYGEIRASVVARLCTCPASLGFADSNACEQGLGDVSGDARDCMIDALADHDGAEDQLRCVNLVFEDYDECLFGGGEFFCVEMVSDEGYGYCRDRREEQLMDLCPGLPADVRSAFLGCLPDSPAATPI